MQKMFIITCNDISGIRMPDRTYPGYVDLACDKFEKDIALLSVLGFFEPLNYPGRGYLEALGLGLEPKDELCAIGSLASITDDNYLDRGLSIDADSLELICEMLDGFEIEGVHFSVRALGDEILIMMKGEGLSDMVSPNYSSGQRGAVNQIIAACERAKKTASVLNRFITKTHKNLNSADIGISPKPNLVLIKSIGRRKEIVGFSNIKGKAICISDDNTAKGVASYLGMKTALIKPGKSRELLHDYDIIWIDSEKPDIDLSAFEENGAVIIMGKEKFGMLKYPARCHIFTASAKKKMIFEKNELLPWLGE